jgi:hypothetical protein
VLRYYLEFCSEYQSRKEEMFWRVANVLMSLLLVATLLWGGCVACPQCFRVPLTKNTCCDPAGHCKGRRTNCSQQESSQFQQLKLQQEVRTPMPLFAAGHLVLPSTTGLIQIRRVIRGSEQPFGSLLESPHSRQAFLSTFLI